MAPNIYYMGAANVVRLGPLRIAGMSGIWKGYNYNKPHHERLPYNQDDIKSIYHVRELDIRKLLQLKTQVDICVSHDWPRAIEKHGDQRALWRMKPDFEQESRDGTLGNLAAAYVMDRLRPPYWFAAHLHCRYAATKVYNKETEDAKSQSTKATESAVYNSAPPLPAVEASVVPHNEDEIDLEMDDDDDEVVRLPLSSTTAKSVICNDKINIEDGVDTKSSPQTQDTVVPEDLRAQLPEAFSRPSPQLRVQPGQPVPATITNKITRFLALDKCLPGRKFLQIMAVTTNSSPELPPIIQKAASEFTPRAKLPFTYDPEWLAITRALASSLSFASTAPDLGEDVYAPLISVEADWIHEHVLRTGKLGIPENFEVTAPVHVSGMPEKVLEGPREWNNPQTAAFCALIGIENMFCATDAERVARERTGPKPEEQRRDGGFRGGRSRGRGGGRGFRSQGGGGTGGRRGRGRGRG